MIDKWDIIAGILVVFFGLLGLLFSTHYIVSLLDIILGLMFIIFSMREVDSTPIYPRKLPKRVSVEMPKKKIKTPEINKYYSDAVYQRAKNSVQENWNSQDPEKCNPYLKMRGYEK